FAPIVDVVATWRDEQPWFRWVGDALSWLVTELGDVVFQPLAWVALAAIVYAGIATAPAPPRAADDGHRGLPGALAADRRVAADHLVGGSPRPRRLPGVLRHRACRGRMARDRPHARPRSARAPALDGDRRPDRPPRRA